MSEPGPESSVEGRPSAGQALAQTVAESAAKRGRSRNVGALRRLAPFLAAHWGRAGAALFFLLLSSSSTLAISWAVRQVVDNLTASGLDPRTVDERFLLVGAVAATLAIATALRFYFVTSTGERVVADLRKAVYHNILTLDPSFFLGTRTGEVLSRLTTDVAIVENLLATSVSVALRNTLIMVGAQIWLVFESVKLTGLVLLTFPFVIAPLFFFGRKVRKLTTNAQDRFGVDYHERYVGTLLKKLGLSRMSARPPRATDGGETVEAFKKP